MSRTPEFYEAAVNYNREKALLLPATYGPVPLPASPAYADIVADFQEAYGLVADGKLGPSTLTAMRDVILEHETPRVLTKDDLVRLAEYTQPFEGQYWSCNRDGEYEGLFDRPPEKYHWASKNKPGSEGTHIGLSFGYIQFTQDGGQLGILLQKMYDTDPARFAALFGEHHKELLEVTQRKGRTRKAGRSPRVQPVGGHDLWSQYWVPKFQGAGRDPVFQRCQVELAVENFMIPALKNCEKLNLRSERSIVIVFDRGVQFGPAGAYTKLLAPARENSGSEHTFLRRFMHKYADQRWGHRVEKIWANSDLWDGPCDWSGILAT